MTPFLVACSLLGTVSIVIWLAVYFHPGRPWDFRPVGDDQPPPEPPSTQPSVCILVPARNEAKLLPRTLPALLTQDYPGPFHVVLVDDRSEDGTAEAAHQAARAAGAEERLTVLPGRPLPEGWVGKVWALQQAASHCGLEGSTGEGPDPQGPIRDPKYFLVTDADIRHAPGSLRRLAAESEKDGLALNSRMARLRCESAAERLLIPPFVFFFNLLYPLRQVNHPGHPLAASAGGCVLLSADALRKAGGFACIRGEIIDDIGLARRIKGPERPIRLALSRTEVESLRAYESLGAIWRMIRRTAFTELRHSWLRLAGCLAALGLMFVVPPALLLGGGLLTAMGLGGGWPVPVTWSAVLLGKGLFISALTARIYRPATVFFRLPAWRAWTLPVAGILYGAMTVSSAWQHLKGPQRGWR